MTWRAAQVVNSCLSGLGGGDLAGAFARPPAEKRAKTLGMITVGP